MTTLKDAIVEHFDHIFDTSILLGLFLFCCFMLRNNAEELARFIEGGIVVMALLQLSARKRGAAGANGQDAPSTTKVEESKPAETKDGIR